MAILERFDVNRRKRGIDRPDTRQRAAGIASGLSILLLTACTTAPVTISTTCLPLAQYTPAFEAQAAAQLGTLPAGSPVAVMITDYGRLRAADRACMME